MMPYRRILQVFFAEIPLTMLWGFLIMDDRKC